MRAKEVRASLGREENKLPTMERAGHPADVPVDTNGVISDIDIPELPSLHGKTADAMVLFDNWSRNFSQLDESGLRTSVVIAIVETLQDVCAREISLFEKQDIYVYRLVQALIELDEEVENCDSLLIGLTFGCDDDGQDLGDRLEDEDAELAIEYPGLYNDGFDSSGVRFDDIEFVPLQPEVMESMGMSKQTVEKGHNVEIEHVQNHRVLDIRQNMTLSGIETINDGSTAMQATPKCIRTEESGNNEGRKALSLLRVDLLRKTMGRGSAHLINTHDEQSIEHVREYDDDGGADNDDDGIVPDSQAEQDIDEARNSFGDEEFEIPNTQVSEKQEGRLGKCSALPHFEIHGSLQGEDIVEMNACARTGQDTKKKATKPCMYRGSNILDDNVDANIQETDVLSGLHATADCVAFPRSVNKAPGSRQDGSEKIADGTKSRRSKRLQAKQNLDGDQDTSNRIAVQENQDAKELNLRNRRLTEREKTSKRKSTSIESNSRFAATPLNRKKIIRRSEISNEAKTESYRDEGAAKNKHAPITSRGDSCIFPEKFKTPPDLAGCSKCRYRGCRKCRGYTLSELKSWQRQHQSTNDQPQLKQAVPNQAPMKNIEKSKLSNILRGLRFMISLPHKDSKSELGRMIQSMGGEVLDSLPSLEDLVSHISIQESAKLNHSLPEVKTVLVTNNGGSRTLKSIFARVMGIPVVSPDWVYECNKKSRLGGFRSRSPHVFIGKGNESFGKILEGLDIYLITESNSLYRKDLSALIQSLGGTLVQEVDPETKRCDLVLFSDPKQPGHKSVVGNVERMARRLRIPSYPISWLTDGIMNGAFTPRIPQSRSKQDTQVIAATFETPSSAASPPQPSIHSPLGRSNCATSKDQDGRISYDEERSTKEKSGHRSRFDDQMRTIYSAFSSLHDIMCPWSVENPLDHAPPGVKKSPIRVYFNSIASVDEVINLGDFVHLLPDPGDKHPKIARVLAFWRQLGRAGENKYFGKFQRYYRFSETSIRQMQITKDDNSNRVFQTNHIEDNVPLTAVISKCNVEMLQYHMEDIQSQQHVDQSNINQEILYCTAMYDYETGALLALHDCENA